ncbi:MAG: efflux RND transporter periplasmic adaptor subunit [Polyangiaceae bacterium]
MNIVEPAAKHPGSPKEGGGRGRGTVIVLVVLGIVLVGFVGFRLKQAAAKRASLAAERASSGEATTSSAGLQFATAAPFMYRPSVDFNGTLRPWREADLGFETQGRLVRVDVSVGQTVKAGAPLATLDASRAGAQVNQATAQTRAAQANLAIAEDNLKRTEALVSSKAIPEAQGEQARQNVALARAQLEAAQATTHLAQVSQGVHTINAPFAGLVTRAPSTPGAVVNPGLPLFRMEDVSRFRLSATVGEEEVDLVKVGAEVRVFYRDRVVPGKVTAVIPSLDQATRRAPIEIEVPNDPKAPILGYGFVRANIDSGHEEKAVRIPALAKRVGSPDEVFRVDGTVVRLVKTLHVVDADGSWIVRKGLEGGDRVILSPPAEMKDGDPASKLTAPSAATAVPMGTQK